LECHLPSADPGPAFQQREVLRGVYEAHGASAAAENLTYNRLVFDGVERALEEEERKRRGRGKEEERRRLVQCS
jgi:hypothetical protein